MHVATLARLRPLSVALLVPLALASRCFAQTAPDTDRLVAVGKLWITVRYFHPYIAYRNIDWDQAFCSALPGIRQAKTPEEYAAALQRMLDALHDPATLAFVQANQVATEPGMLRFEQSNGTLIVSAVRGESKDAPGVDSQLKTLGAALEQAPTVVFDLRTSSFLSRLLDDPAIQSELTASPLELPGQRTWMHNGLKPYRGADAGTYYSAFLVKPGEQVNAHAQLPDRHIAFLLGDGSQLPAAAAALWTAGKAAVVTESPKALVDTPETVTISMGDAVEAVVRLSEAVTAEGKALPQPLVETSKGSLDRAIAVARNSPVPQSVRPLPPFPIEGPQKAYADQPYPSDELRILAAIKIWGTFHYFFAYKDLMDEDWDEDFAQFLPRFEAAKNARDYNLAVSEMVVRVDDSHAAVDSDVLNAYFGEAPPPLGLRLIEKKPVVTHVLEEAKAAGITIGDIVMDVDHNDTVERANIQAKYVSASTRAWLGDRIMQRLLNGPEGSIATLKIKSAGGQEKEVQLKRSKAYLTELEIERGGDTVQMLPGGIGYVDLNRLALDAVNPMWDKLREAKAIVFDIRGRAGTGAANIASRLVKERGTAGTIVNGPLAMVPDVPTAESVTKTSSYFFVQSLPKSSQPAYSGKTIMLVDERTIGPAERVALFCESANNTAFVGSPSAGAISDETNFVIPGGIVIGLSGRDVRHGNSGQVQRLGIQPTVAVMPSIAGIRHGKDEVLEKGLEYAAAQ